MVMLNGDWPSINKHPGDYQNCTEDQPARLIPILSLGIHNVVLSLDQAGLIRYTPLYGELRHNPSPQAIAFQG